MASSKPARAYHAVAGPLAEAVLREVAALPPGEIERLEDVLRPLTAWRVPAVAEHAEALLDALGALRTLRGEAG